MSQVYLEPKDPGHEVMAGLDKPMNTYFISVFVKQDDDDLRDLDPIEFKHRWRREEVVQKLEKYCKPCERLDEVIKYIHLDLDPGDYVGTSIPKSKPIQR